MSRKSVLIMTACIIMIALVSPSVCLGAPRDRVNGDVVYSQQRVGGFTRTYRAKIVAPEGLPGLLESGYTCNNPLCSTCTSGGWHVTQSAILSAIVIEPGVATFLAPGPCWMRIVDGGKDYATDNWYGDCDSGTHGLTGGWPIPMMIGNFSVHIAK